MFWLLQNWFCLPATHLSSESASEANKGACWVMEEIFSNFLCGQITVTGNKQSFPNRGTNGEFFLIERLLVRSHHFLLGHQKRLWGEIYWTGTQTTIKKLQRLYPFRILTSWFWALKIWLEGNLVLHYYICNYQQYFIIRIMWAINCCVVLHNIDQYVIHI